MCLRVWKAKAAAPLGPQVYRERAALAYREKLLEKYERLPEIKRILRCTRPYCVFFVYVSWRVSSCSDKRVF